MVVGKNLLQLMEQKHMVDRPGCYDETCISLSLGHSYIRFRPNSEHTVLTYGDEIPPSCIEQFDIGNDGLVIPPHTAILSSSAEEVHMPQGYMGLLQTKGSLARLCVSLHFSDGQIDPGFKGHVTFEIFNASEFSIRIRKLQLVGNLYVLKTSSKCSKLYSGKYAGSVGPTIQLPSR